MSLSHFANRVGTYLTVLSHGKFALNKYMASAINNGIDIQNPDACLVVNIGMTRTDLFIISKGQVLSLRATSISCETFLDDIIFHMARMHNTRIDEPIAKQIWDAVGTANPESDGEPDVFEVVGPNRVTGLPMFIPVSYQEITHCLRRDSMSLVLTIDRILETVPAILIKPLFSRGIFLIGEGAALRGFAQCIEDTLRIPCTAIVSSKG